MKLIEKVEEIRRQEDPASSEGLVMLVDVIRPPKNQLELASKNLKKFIGFLQSHPQEKEEIKNYLQKFVGSRQLVQLFTDSGIQTSKGFFTEAINRINTWFLPRSYGDSDHTATFNDVFHKRWDHKWVQAISQEDWFQLFQELDLKELSKLNPEERMITQLLNSVLVLSQRLAALGLEPEILSKLPELEEFDSPFMVQNKDIFDYLDQYQHKEDFDRTNDNPDYKQILVMLNQCQDYSQLIRKNKRKYGADLYLTFLLYRINQTIARLRNLLKMAVDTPDEIPFESEIGLLKTLVRTENKKNSLSEHFDNNVRILAFQITEHAGKTGEHYITNSTKEWWKMLLSSMGGGLIVGFLTIFKVFIYYMKLPPFGEAFMYSMNYSLGFIGIHVTHSTLATKQPAMTASKLAAALDDSNKPKSEGIENLAEVIVRISRSQFIAFVGNVMIAFPVAFIVAYTYFYFTGSQVAESEKAFKLIDELHPFESYAIFHAGIAGVFLFLSGLISGYYDNKSIYNKIPQRLQRHPFLNAVLGKERNKRFSAYIDQNLGSLAGNFFLGIFLGSTGTLGFILGLPLDIRHITFASGNFGLAFVSVGDQLNQYQIGMAILGIVCIGLMNFLVSFSLAIFVAIKSRNVTFRQRKELFSTLIGWFFLRPGQFFYPPRKIKQIPKELESKMNEFEEKDSEIDFDDEKSEKVRPVKDS